MNNSPSVAASYGLWALIIGVLFLYHQVSTWGRIDLDQILHHEWFAGVLIAFALGIMLVIGWHRFMGAAFHR